MPLKSTIEQDGQKYALLNDDGDPIYDVDGKDVGYNGEDLHKKVGELNSESASRRRALSEANEKLERLDKLEGIEEKYKGIDDPKEAIKALETVKNLNDKQLIDAGEVEKVRQDAINTVEEKWQKEIKDKYEPVIAERDKFRSDLQNEILSNHFAQSRFIQDKMIVPAEMVQATFGKHFKVDEKGKLDCKDEFGEDIRSTENPGKKADFDEALQILVEKSAHADRILKGANKSGGGGSGGGGTPPNDGNFLTQTVAAKMAVEEPTKFADYMSKGYVVIDDSDA